MAMTETLQDPAPETERGRKTFPLIAISGLCALLALFLTDLPASADDVLHHLIAKAGLEDPWRLLDIWGRAGFSILHVLPAQLGLLANQIYSIGLALLTAWLVRRALRSEPLWVRELGGAFALVQTYAFQLSFGTMTETVFALALALGFERWRNGKLWQAALAFSWTGITRLEGLPLLGVIGVAFLFALGPNAKPAPRWPQRLFAAGLLGLFPLVWNLMLSARGGFEEPLALLTQNHFVTSERGAYGQGDWYKFIVMAPHIFGLGVFSAMLFGFRRAWNQGFRVELAYFAAFYALQSILWAFGLFRTAGYARFFASIAPLAAILGALGAPILIARVGFLRRLGPAKAALCLVVIGLVHGLAWNAVCDAFHRPDGKSLRAAVETARVHLAKTPKPLLVADHPYVVHWLGVRPFDRKERLATPEVADFRALPPGTVVLLTAGPYSSARGFAAISAEPEDPALKARLTESELLSPTKPWVIHRLKGTNPYFEQRSDHHVVRNPGLDPNEEAWPYWVSVAVRSAVPAPEEAGETNAAEPR